IKSAEGLLVTASGCLVVPPTAAAGGRSSSVGEAGAGLYRDRSCGKFSDDDDDDREGDRKNAFSTSMVSVRATWPLTLVWVDPERNLNRYPPREMEIGEVVDIARGHKTPAFWQQAAHRGIHTLPAPELCFSLMGHQRTLDLAAESMLEAKVWVRALADVALRLKRGGNTAGGAFYGDPPPRRPWGEVVGRENTTSARGLREKKEQQAGRHKENPADDEASSTSGNPSTRVSSSNFRLEKRVTGGQGGETWSVETVRSWRRRLFPAVSRGDAGTVSAIFDQGCPVDLAQVGTGDSPLLLACRLGNIGVAGECLRRGSRNDPHPDFGQTALQAAVASGQEGCARLLLETASPSRSDAVVSNHKDPNEETPLHIACSRGYGGIVEALLHHGADLRLVDRDGGTPMHGAARAGQAGALASLLDAGGDAVLEEKNRRGDRALHLAAAAGHIACVELLLGTAAEPDTPNTDGKTPFALASIGGHLAVTRLIRQYAPAAGTPSGSDALNRSDRKGNIGGGEGGSNANIDALPRPHGSGSSLNCPGTPEHRNQNLEDRCYSAARLGHRRFGMSGEKSLSVLCCQEMRSLIKACAFTPLLLWHASRPFLGLALLLKPCRCATDGCCCCCCCCCSLSLSLSLSLSPSLRLLHYTHGGSLFDGLQVYVVGGRQPLGSQQGSSSSAAGTTFPTASTTSAHDSTRALSSQQQTLPHHHQGYFSSQQEIPSPLTRPYPVGTMTTPNVGGHILSAPLTLAPTPPPTHRNLTGTEPSMATFFVASGEGEHCNYSLPPSTAVSTNTLTDKNVGRFPAGSPPSTTAAVPGGARALARMIYFSNRASASGSASANAYASVSTSVSASVGGGRALEAE
ncbi:unnamed protein product, partial [Laminaria digitata]